MNGFESGSGEFADLLEIERYGKRSDIFDQIIADTHLHFWDPRDPSYVDFARPLRLDEVAILPYSEVPELNSAVADRLDDAAKLRFANESARWWVSGFLHGEQGALSLALSLCQVLSNPGAIEYATNQAREESRHVDGFSRYIHSRWSSPVACSSVFSTLLTKIIKAPEVFQKIIGMQVLVEGLAMGFMSRLHRKSNDPTLVRLSQLVMSDEAFHHKVGKLWAERALDDLSEEHRIAAEDWALECFQSLMFNVMNPSQKKHLYEQFGLDEQWVRGALRESYTAESRRQEMAQSDSVFRILIRALLKTNIVTERTRAAYESWVNLDELRNEPGDGIEMMIAAEGVESLRQINAERNKRSSRISREQFVSRK